MTGLRSSLGPWASSGGEPASAIALARDAYRDRRIVCINLDWPMAPVDREALVSVAERVLFKRGGA